MICSILEMERKNNQLRLTERYNVINIEQREKTKQKELDIITVLYMLFNLYCS